MQITHNIPALRALNSLNKVNLSADKRMRNLSSGLRINTAADDAAGMAIVNKMKTQVKGLKRASMNSEDGISLVQTAEGALGEVHNMLQRMRELAVQGANGTLAEEDRRAIQDEVDQLKQQITSTAELTEFNKLKLLNGQLDRRSFSKDNTIGESSYVSDTVQPGKYEFRVSGAGAKATWIAGDPPTLTGKEKITKSGVGRININGEEVIITEGMTGEQVFEAVRDLCQRVDIAITKSGGAKGELKLVSKEAGSSQKIKISSDNMSLLREIGLASGINPKNPTSKAAKYMSGTDAQVKVIATSGGFNSTATVIVDGNRAVFTDSNYQKIIVDIKSGIKPTTEVDKKQSVTVLDAGPLQLQVGPNEGMKVDVQIPKLTSTALGLEFVNMRTAAGASKAISLCDSAIKEISAVRSKLGAYQNRLEYTINNLDTTSENTTAALSRIEDADMAEEMAEYTQKNVISQAGVSMLANANKRPQQVLNLLQ